MNYNMQGMEKSIPELYSMLKSVEVEIKKEHQLLMVNKTTIFKKDKGKKNFKKDGKGVAAPGKQAAGKNQRMDASLRMSVFIARETVIGSGTALNIWWIRRMAK